MRAPSLDSQTLPHSQISPQSSRCRPELLQNNHSQSTIWAQLSYSLKTIKSQSLPPRLLSWTSINALSRSLRFPERVNSSILCSRSSSHQTQPMGALVLDHFSEAARRTSLQSCAGSTVSSSLLVYSSRSSKGPTLSPPSRTIGPQPQVFQVAPQR